MAPSALSPTVTTSGGLSFSLLATTAPTSTSKSGYRGYDHVHWYVGNAKQAASYYITRMGFRPLAKRGLETGSRDVASHVIFNGSIIFVFTSPLRDYSHCIGDTAETDKLLLYEIHQHLRKHGDGVKDVAFEVDNVRAVYDEALTKGAKVIQPPNTIRDDKDGEVVTAVIQTYGDTTHTLVERSRYYGAFLPGYRACSTEEPLMKYLPQVSLEDVDHCVGNQGWNEMEAICE